MQISNSSCSGMFLMLHVLMCSHFRETPARTDFPEREGELSLLRCSPVGTSEFMCICLGWSQFSPVLENPNFMELILMYLCPLSCSLFFFFLPCSFLIFFTLKDVNNHQKAVRQEGGEKMSSLVMGPSLIVSSMLKSSHLGLKSRFFFFQKQLPVLIICASPV